MVPQDFALKTCQGKILHLISLDGLQLASVYTKCKTYGRGGGSPRFLPLPYAKRIVLLAARGQVQAAKLCGEWPALPSGPSACAGEFLAGLWKKPAAYGILYS